LTMSAARSVTATFSGGSSAQVATVAVTARRSRAAGSPAATAEPRARRVSDRVRASA
jgi:hypothetical protein